MADSNALLPPLTAIFDDLLAAFFDTPLLRIQQLLQTKDINPAFQTTKPPSGAIDCISKIGQQEGLKGYWRSYIPLASSYVLRQISDIIHELYLTQKIPKETSPIEKNNQLEAPKSDVSSPNTVTEVINQQKPSHLIEKPAQSGLELSAFIVGWGIIQHPIEVIQLRLACNFMGKFSGNNANIRSTFQDLLKNGGVKNLYRGYIPLTLYSLLDKNLLTPLFGSYGKGNNNTFGAMMYLRDLILYPLVVVSSRLMIQPNNSLAKFNGVIDCFKYTYKENGIRGLFRGFQVPTAIYLATTIINNASKITGP